MTDIDLAAQLVSEHERAERLRARVAELEREMEKEVELRMHSLRIGLEAARREAKKIADLEQQVAALADALEKCCDTISEWYVQDREGVETAAQARLLAYLNVPALSKARNLLANMKEQAALRAAGRKT